MTKQYLVEKKDYLLEQDLYIVRHFYQPLLGAAATCLYQNLVDQTKKTTPILKYFSLNVLNKMMGITQVQFERAKIVLEALGLLRTYEKLDQNIFIFLILKPLDPQAFLKNRLLTNQLRAKIGEIEFEKLFYDAKVPILNKDEFQDITTKYHQIFDLNLEQTPPQTVTSEIAIPTYDNVEEASKYLTAEQFIPYLTNERAVPSQLKQLQNLKASGFSNYSLNLLINYSFEVNNKVVFKYITKIASDFFNKNILLPEDIMKELDRALKSKKQPLQTSLLLHQERLEGYEDSLDDVFTSLHAL